MIIDVDISPKALRETLCIAQTRIGNSGLDKHRQELDIAHLQALIDECDRHRPLGPDGKHGDLHTTTCGCKDAMPCLRCGHRVDWHTGGICAGDLLACVCDWPNVATATQPPGGGIR